MSVLKRNVLGLLESVFNNEERFRLISYATRLNKLFFNELRQSNMILISKREAEPVRQPHDHSQPGQWLGNDPLQLR